MKVKKRLSWSIEEITLNEIRAIVKTLGRISDAEHRNQGLTWSEIAAANDVYSELDDLLADIETFNPPSDAAIDLAAGADDEAI